MFLSDQSHLSFWTFQLNCCLFHCSILLAPCRNISKFQLYLSVNISQLSYATSTVLSSLLHFRLCPACPPGFGWDRVIFLPRSWYSGAVCIQGEKNVDNTRMFYLALSSAHCNQGLLSVSCSASEQDTGS